jgi:hypothetical protein
MAWSLGIVGSVESAVVLLYPNHWGLVVVDLSWGNLLVGNWGRLIHVCDWGWLVGVADWRGLIVDLRRLRSKTLYRLEASVRDRRFRHIVV